MQFPRLSLISKAIGPVVLLCSSSLWAQEEAPVAAPPPEAQAPTVAPDDAAPEASDATGEVGTEETNPAESVDAESEAEPEPEPEPEPVAEAPPEEAKAEDAPKEEGLGGINWGVWGRVDVAAGGGEDLDDVSSSGVFELHSSGSLHEYINFTANFTAGYNPDMAGNASLLDGIFQLDFADEFHIWAGRMLVPVDRSNFSGPWFMTPWYYPGFGFADGQVGAPREGPSGRNDGTTIWGSFGGGIVKYYAGAFDLHDINQSPLYSGRINISLLDPEPGFYSNSSYLGKDILAIGIGGQVKKNGSVGAPVDPADPNPTADYTGFNADILFEKNFGSAGVLNLEGAVYLFNGDYEPTDASWFAVASYLLPGEVGIGKLQPVVRVQQAVPSADGADTSTLLDGQLSYLVDEFAARMSLGYRYGFAGDLTTQTLYLGAQFLK